MGPEVDQMDDILLNKMSIIENCLKRIKEEYVGHEDELEYNYAKQDSVVLNLQRACEASIDLGTRLIRLNKLGVPQGGRDVFTILERGKLLSPEISKKMQAMVGFRNIAVHDYQKMNFTILRAILNHHLSDFREFICCIQNLGGGTIKG
jgi:uncharacterized protein YutE (UPF0331/DUF86 family)